MGKLVKPENRQIEGAWFKDRWKEGEENWEDVRVKQDHPEDVLAGLHRLRPAPKKNAPIPMELLGRQSNIGRSVTLLGASDFLDVLNLESDDQKSRAVTFHTVASQEFGIIGAAENIEGRIIWGAGGVQAVVDFDWLLGVTFSVVCSFARLQVRSTAAFPVGTSVKLGAFAGYGDLGAGSRQTLQQSIDIGNINPAAFGAVQIPLYAKDVFIARAVDNAFLAPPAMRVFQMLPNNVIIIASEQYALGVPMERPMPISRRAISLRIENISPAAFRAAAIFGLAI